MCPVEDVVENALVDRILTFLDESEGECTDLAIRKLCKCTFNDVWEALYNIFDARNPVQALSLYGFMVSVNEAKRAYIPDSNNRMVLVKMSQENNEGNVVPYSLSDWIFTTYTLAKEKGWWDGEPNFPEKLCLMHSEISEVLEEYRKGKPVNEIYYVDGKPEGAPIELADIFIRMTDLCGHYGIDLEKAVAIKHGFNTTRPYRHGNKIC